MKENDEITVYQFGLIMLKLGFRTMTWRNLETYTRRVFMLTETQAKYIELEKKKEQYKAYLEELKATTEQLQSEMGDGGHFQDGEGTVYQIADHKGKWVHFDKYQIKRTRRQGEKSGSLSLTDAKNLGYEVK